MTASLIGLDWGTTSFRAWRMGADGQVLDRVNQGPGILAAAKLPGGFQAALTAAIGPWLHPSVPIIASGMITSRNGWVETPYQPLPLGVEALAQTLVDEDFDGHRIWFVSGAISDRDGPSPDVMRGEETEIIGHIAASGVSEGRFILPGTHNKWAQVQDGKLTAFRTVMTGEVFQLLSEHSILGRLIQQGAPSPAAFLRGLQAGAADGPLLGRIFSARSLALMDRLAATEVADYLSGLLIGDEVAHSVTEDAQRTVTIIGRGDLAERYLMALQTKGIEATIAAPGMAQRGLWTIAKHAGII
ncbi:2-dehydro-3-deoxygalactonokinase [Paracoccus sp. 11-3]|uniref:2-dehydro-3-deoxygalactonokinase n=1 Tax=Paracoccus amoyensis TaxID=2760093 RepID=A0A926GDB8_9RHOB|nr:2-dehydro-3-deoxygalactonokinase [Paracoccus amoyensis]MBC9245294.1 2-dehydro-3-deoxygalactonokinase [Paracoccus amoyensis]